MRLQKGSILRKFWEKSEEAAGLDALIASILYRMRQMDEDSPEYPKLMDHLERLYQLKAKERRQPISRDTLMLVFGNLAGILIIVAYEQKHVMTSKGLGQIIRPRTDQ